MKKFILLLIAVVLIVGLYIYLKPKSTQESTNTSTSTNQSQTQNQPTTKSVTLVVKNKQLVSGPSSIQVNQGDTVSITITNDTNEELHLHGYNKMLELTANQPGTMTFTANLTGRFIYELEGSSTEIGELDVEPK